MDLKDRKFVVAGTGKSGIGAAGLLLSRGARVVLFDENEKRDRDAVLGNFAGDANVTLVLGTLSDSDIAGSTAMVISPGISIEAGFTDAFRKAGIPIWSEVELAFRLGKGRLAAITGTNGKTTTTALTGEILKEQYDSTFVVGNIGTPYTSVVNDMKDDSVTAAEISSFQLEAVIDFHPHVSAVLNVTPDHLNRHHTMEIYADTKMRIAARQTADDYCVLNYDDPTTRSMADKIHATPVFFSRKADLSDGVCLEGDEIVMKKDGKVIASACHIPEMKLLGGHNVENVMAAFAIGYYMGVPAEKIHHAITCFKAVPHRIEYVETINGVDYYNDSKGTNPDAAIKGIQAMVKPTVLIGGGYDKGVPFDDWIKSFDGKVRYLILFGVTAQQIADTARKYGFENIIFVNDLKEAVETAYEKAEPGNAVLLSPACASWDMFDSYEQRGDMFKDYVRQLKER